MGKRLLPQRPNLRPKAPRLQPQRVRPAWDSRRKWQRQRPPDPTWTTIRKSDSEDLAVGHQADGTNDYEDIIP